MPEARLPPTAVRMNHERLPRHGLYFAISSFSCHVSYEHQVVEVVE
jgi:hypothetical protein